MKWYNKLLTLIKSRAGLASSVKRAMVIIERSQYQELKKVYKVSLPDLLQIVRNEIHVLSKNGKVLWLVKKRADNHYLVSYATLDNATSANVNKRIQFLWPQSWLLYYYCQPEQLYLVNGATPYWAYLDAVGNLQTTTARGLMVTPDNFMAAIGKKVASPITVTTQQIAKTVNLPLLANIGVICSKPSRVATPSINWRKIVSYSAVLAGIYAVVLSAVLQVTESYLADKTQHLQEKANRFFDKQVVLQHRLETLNRYTEQLNAHAPTGQMLSDISQAIPPGVLVQNIRLNGRLMQIAGQADSATEVLASFANSTAFSEPQFDRGVVRVREKESFSLSVVYQGESTSGGSQ